MSTHENAGGGGHHSNLEVMQLSESSRSRQAQHQATLLELDAKKIAATIHVPTLPQEVRQALRDLGQPVRLFGENLANVRERLRMAMAMHRVTEQHMTTTTTADAPHLKPPPPPVDEEEAVTKYTRASHELVVARQAMATFSLQRAQARLAQERKQRRKQHYKRPKRTVDDNSITRLYQKLSNLTLQGSQYGDERALSDICVGELQRQTLLCTASWTGNVHVWDGNSSAALIKLGEKRLGHEDRIMNLDVTVPANGDSNTLLLATASIDQTAKVWKVQKRPDVVMDDNDDNVDTVVEHQTMPYSITEVAHFRGHSARLGRVAFHPIQSYVATTSADYTWRLWDMATSQELLLQDGHYRGCYGLGFHPDGSLVATTDYCGVVQLWDLRSGKSIHHFVGQHVRRVLNACFHANGCQLGTAGDDGTIKIWDLRRRLISATVPAHSNVITSLRLHDEYAVSSSFDGTAKVWSCRDWKMLRELPGHEGKVTSVDIIPSRNELVTTGWDKTLKLWA